MRRAFQIECKRGIYSAGFYIGILLIFAAGLTNIGQTLEYIQSPGLPEGEVRCFALLFQAMMAQALCFLVPVASTLAVSASYLDDQQSGMINYIMIRTTKKRYIWSKVLSCGLLGGLTVFVALAGLLLVFAILFPISSIESVYMKKQTAQYFIYLFGRMALLVLNGILYATLGGTIAALTNNKYMAYAAPFIFYYVISTLFSAYLPKLYLLNPEEWLMWKMSSTFEVFGVLLVANVIIFVGYLKMIERRWAYE